MKTCSCGSLAMCRLCKVSSSSYSYVISISIHLSMQMWLTVIFVCPSEKKPFSRFWLHCQAPSTLKASRMWSTSAEKTFSMAFDVLLGEKVSIPAAGYLSDLSANRAWIQEAWPENYWHWPFDLFKILQSSPVWRIINFWNLTTEVCQCATFLSWRSKHLMFHIDACDRLMISWQSPKWTHYKSRLFSYMRMATAWFSL